MFSVRAEIGRLIHVHPMSAISSIAFMYLATASDSVAGGVTHICRENPRICSVLRVLGCAGWLPAALFPLRTPTGAGDSPPVTAKRDAPTMAVPPASANLFTECLQTPRHSAET